jgi:hypothetical protein
MGPHFAQHSTTPKRTRRVTTVLHLPTDRSKNIHPRSWATPLWIHDLVQPLLAPLIG